MSPQLPLFLILCGLNLMAQCDSWQVVGSDPIPYRFEEIIWDDSKFVAAVSDPNAGMIISSQTGEPPWLHTLIHDGPVVDIDHNGATYAAIGSNGFLAVSDDLQDWQTIDLGSSFQPIAIEAGIGYWTALSDGKIYRGNTSARSWSVVAEADLHEVRLVNNRMIGVGDNGIIMTSSDGTDWTVIDTGNLDLRTIVWSGFRYVAAGNSSFVVTSTDLETWTTRNTDAPGSFHTAAWTGNHFVMPLGPDFVISNNGISWQIRNSGAADVTSFRAMVSNGERTLAGADSGLVYGSLGVFTWVPYSFRFTNNPITLGAARMGTAIATWLGGGEYLISENAVSWELQTFDFQASDQVTALDGDHRMFLAGTTTGKAATSTNGLDWTLESAANTAVEHVAAGNQLLMLVSSFNRVYTRPAIGGQWSQASPLPGTINALVAGRSQFIAVADQGRIYTSNDGNSWVTRPTATNNDLYGITYRDAPSDGYVAVGAQATILFSTNGLTWSRNHTGDSDLLDAVWAGDRYLALGDGDMLESSNGLQWASTDNANTRINLEMIGFNGFNTFAGGDSGILLATDCSDNCTAVAVTAQPQDQILTTGATAIMSVTVSGQSPVSYQWFHDDTSIQGADQRILQIPSLDETDAGLYQCRITNACSLALSQPAQLIIAGPPEIQQQPQDLELCANGTASFEVSASGIGELSYLWLYNGSPLTSQTSAVLNLFTVSVPQAGQYSCVVSNQSGSVTSNPAVLTVANQPLINIQPDPERVCFGDNASLRVVGISSGTLSYQWFRDGTAIPGADSDTLGLSAIGHTDLAEYYCQLTTLCGSIDSETAAISLDNPPLVLHQPMDQVLCPGSNLNLSVSAGGEGPFSYQWSHNGTPLPGATLPVYERNDLSLLDAGFYNCHITNPCGTVSSNPASLTVSGQVSVTGAPQSGVVCSGQSLSLLADVSDTTALAWQWQKDGVEIPGAVTAAYTQTISPDSAGTYRVLVTATCGVMLSPPQVIQVDTVPVVTQHPQPVMVCEGQGTTFTVSGEHVTAWQWLKDNLPISGAESPILELTNLSLTDTGAYSCRLIGACAETVTQPAELSIPAAPQISLPPQDSQTCSGEPLTLSIEAVNADSYQWSKDGVEILGAVNPTLVIESVTPNDAGAYRCTLTSPCTVLDSDIAQITITGPFTLPALPQQLTFCQGDEFSLSVSPVGDGPFNYQWLRNGKEISGAVSSNHTITNAQPADSATYSCVVSDSCMQLTSNGAQISVLAPVSIDQHPNNAVLCSQPVTLTAGFSGQSLEQFWTKDGVRIEGSETSLIIPPEAASVGVYRFVIEGLCNTAMTTPADITHGILSASQPFQAVAQGFEPLSLWVDTACAVEDISLVWTSQNGTVLAEGQTQITIDPPPQDTTTYRAALLEPLANVSKDLFFTILVSPNPMVGDANGDGCNTIADLWLAGSDWEGPDPRFDADGNHLVNILDLLYININQQSCSPD